MKKLKSKPKKKAKANDLPQRTFSGTVMHLLWVLTVVTLVIALTVAEVGGIIGKMLLDRGLRYYEDEIQANVNNDGFLQTVGNQKLNQTSFIYAYDKSVGDYVQIRQLYATENRVIAEYDEIPEALKQAAVAIEDKRFWEHDGVDWIRTISAAGMMFLGSGGVYGGSTITQQLIKNLTRDDEVTVRRKLNEIARALEFEQHYTKEEILCKYLNTIYLGEGAYGVKSAARVYFDKDLSELTLKECACIIGITNNPSLYDPYIYPENNERRTLTILQEMYEQGYIETQEEYDAACAQELVFINGTTKNEVYACENCEFEGELKEYKKTDDGYVCPECETLQHFVVENDYYTYFEDQIVRDVQRDLCEAYGLTEDAASDYLTTGGFIIYSTIDLDVQRSVDEVYQNLDNVPQTYSNKQLQSAIVVIDNETGDIIAMAGGVGEKEGSLTLNRATQSRLSPGSSIKPLTVYGPALEYGIITPASAYEDSAYMQINGRDWPQNDSREYSGWMLVNNGLAKSLNTIAVKVLADLTPEKSFDFAKNQLGLENLLESDDSNGHHYTDISLAPLGMGQLTYGVTVREMATAYATFPNQGTYRGARTYTKVVDSDGNVILDNTQETHRAMSDHTAWYITYMLKNAVSYGTGTAAQMSNTPVAGKTGTTSSNRDRWFAGYTPYYTAVVWCGFDEPEEIKLVVNRNPALVMWKNVMTKLMDGLERKEFVQPTDEAFVYVSVCSETGLLAGEDCTETKIRLFASDVPTKTCNNHEGFEVEICYPDASNTEEKYVATEWCKEYYELTHSEAYLEVVAAGLLDMGNTKLNDVVTETILVLVPDSEQTDHAATKEDAIEQAELKECTVHTKVLVDALRQMINAAWEKLHEAIPPEETTEPPTEEPPGPPEEDWWH